MILNYDFLNIYNNNYYYIYTRITDDFVIFTFDVHVVNVEKKISFIFTLKIINNSRRKLSYKYFIILIGTIS